MTSWDPAQYERYAGERLRPALDLVARIPIAPRSIWDLGCGTGSITALLAERWPEASVGGLDSSPAMLDQAREIPGIEWRLGDIASWEPEQPPELVFSNAALHWLGGHATLLPRIAAQVAREVTGHLVRPAPVAEPAEYHHLLSGRFATLDVWETVYFQVLEGEDAVAEWARGTAARPYLDALEGNGEEFMADYASRLRRAYPRIDDGTTLFPFRRLFIIGEDPIG